MAYLRNAFYVNIFTFILHLAIRPDKLCLLSSIEWAYSRVGVQSSGRTVEWAYSRVGVQSSGRTIKKVRYGIPK